MLSPHCRFILVSTSLTAAWWKVARALLLLLDTNRLEQFPDDGDVDDTAFLVHLAQPSVLHQPTDDLFDAHLVAQDVLQGTIALAASELARLVAIGGRRKRPVCAIANGHRRREEGEEGAKLLPDDTEPGATFRIEGLRVEEAQQIRELLWISRVCDRGRKGS